MRCLAAAAWLWGSVPGEVQPQPQHQRHDGRGQQPHPRQPPRRYPGHQLPHATAGRATICSFSTRTWSLVHGSLPRPRWHFQSQSSPSLGNYTQFPFRIFFFVHILHLQSVTLHSVAAALPGETRHLENSWYIRLTRLPARTWTWVGVQLDRIVVVNNFGL